MPGIKEYIQAFGDVPFAARPFGDADNLTLCQVFYMPFEQVVSPDFSAEPVPFSDVCYAMFAKRGYHHSRLGLMIPNDASVNMMAMEPMKRFAEMKLWAVQETFEHEPAVQFAAGTFLLPDGTAVIIYRGTDDTIIGWKEDMDIFINGSIPSYQLALDYLNGVAAHTEGNIILCGHSKGGHLALYAALKTDAATRARIQRVYNNDGPGYEDYSLFATDASREILPRYRHLVPHSSAVGMVLSHDYDFTAVVSNLPLGPLQHDLCSWQIENGELVTREDVDNMAKITDVAFSEFLGSFSDASRQNAGDIAATLIRAVNIDSLADTARQLPQAARRFGEGWFGIAKDARKLFWKTIAPMPKIIVSAAKNIKEETVPNAAKAAAVYLGKASATV